VLKQLDRVSASDLITDGDGVVRRAILYPVNGNDIIPSLGLAVATSYLKKQGITPTSDNYGSL